MVKNSGGSRSSTVGALALLAIAICWGSTFFSTKEVLDRIPSTDYAAIRFGIAVIVLVAIAPKSLRMPRKVYGQASIIGVVFAGAMLTQLFGLKEVSASVSGFITGIYVVVTPLLGALMFKVRTKGVAWVAVGLATVGLAVMSINLGTGVIFGRGELITLISALLWGLHISLVGHWVRPENAMGLTIVSTAVATVIFLIGGLQDGLTLPQTPTDWAWMLYFGIIVGAITEFGQFWAQARVPATLAAVLMVTEPLWATVFALLFGGETLTTRLVIGGLLMITAMVISVWASKPDQATSAAVAPASSDAPMGTPESTTANPIGPSV